MMVKKDEMFWDGSKTEVRWLEKCAVGVLRSFDDVSSVNDRLTNEGLSFSSSYLGDKYVLWEFDSEKECCEFINNRFLWDDRFSIMEKWSSSITMKADMRWIKFMGVPLSWWNSKFFTEIGRLIGDPIMIDENCLSRRNLLWERVLVLIPDSKKSPDKIKVVSSRFSTTIVVEEEQTPVVVSWVDELIGLKKGKKKGGKGKVVIPVKKGGSIFQTVQIQNAQNKVSEKGEWFLEDQERDGECEVKGNGDSKDMRENGSRDDRMMEHYQCKKGKGTINIQAGQR
ncbi:hypothetical protein Dsin_013626 [Dipteronia sinensis]|uniref:DUF4283 domain-containing protein n=1 Tax=Dipteronia sinensis TaxID=43782 RepID=A0AAE0AKB0_9ROSI|nr:hypothetical protein Dsin_013626 [Dipteronia sinensis]